ncbi:MAG: enoyl-CoA hydratase/isomerase family protein [Syntrophomonas sp.]
MMGEKNNRLVLLEAVENTATVVLNNPPANVLTQDLIEQLSQAFRELEHLPVSAVIITGQGTHSFSTGANINELLDNELEQNRMYFSNIYETFNLIANCRYPVIAAVNGYAYGAGLELALCADIRVIDQNAHLAATGVNLNLVFCTQRLARLAGPGRAKDMLFRARELDAAEALEFGLAEHISPPGTAYEKAKEIALRISRKGQAAVQSIKQALNQGLDLPLNQALDLEAESIYKMFATNDFKRRARLFLTR